MITPTDYSLTIYRESAFDAEFDFTNADGSAYDFTGWDLSAQLQSADPANATAFQISVDEMGGTIVLSLTSDVTEALNVNSRTTYRIKAFGPDASGPYFLVKGNVSVIDVS